MVDLQFNVDLGVEQSETTELCRAKPFAILSHVEPKSPLTSSIIVVRIGILRSSFLRYLDTCNDKMVLLVRCMCTENQSMRGVVSAIVGSEREGLKLCMKTRRLTWRSWWVTIERSAKATRGHDSWLDHRGMRSSSSKLCNRRWSDVPQWMHHQLADSRQFITPGDRSSLTVSHDWRMCKCKGGFRSRTVGVYSRCVIRVL